MAEQLVDTLNLKLDERNIGGGYNTVNMVDLFKEKLDWLVGRISRLK